MQCYSELTPPTAVTHSLSLPFTSATANNLIVAKTSLLQIFTTKIVTIEDDESRESDASKQNGKWDATINDETLETSFAGVGSIMKADRVKTTKLILVAEYTLSGTITSLARIKTLSSKSGGESLLIGLKDAKLSLVQWDPERPGLSTISIHYYEQDDLQGAPWAPFLKECVNYISADPGSRCAALKFSARNLAILPFKQDEEDVQMDDWDEDLDGPRPDKAEKVANGIEGNNDTPYSSSFVLRLPALDPNLIHPVHLAFLYEYREPTFGILASSTVPASSLIFERKDYLTYSVFTLDLTQKASTTILSVTGLPYDLIQIIPIPAPIGGALLVGSNELIHIDQAGKANGVAVNVFAKQCTSFGLADQSDLDMRLEGAKIEQLSIRNGEMIILLQSGELGILSFRLDGRSVSGLDVRRVSAEVGGSILPGRASTISPLGQDTFFVGSESTDSVVFGWNTRSSQLTRRKTKVETREKDDIFMDEDEDEEEDDDVDDDLYGEGPSTTTAITNGSTGAVGANSKAGDYIFKIHDRLMNIAPIVDMTFGKCGAYQNEDDRLNAEGVTGDLELVAAVGAQKGGTVAVVHRKIQPKVVGKFEFPEARGIWTMRVKKPTEKGLEAQKGNPTMNGDYGVNAQYDEIMIVSKVLPDGTEQSDVYALTEANFEALTGTEFEPADGATIEAGTMGNGERIIQVLKSVVRVYDGNLGLIQILPMSDEESGAEPSIISASFADPFLLLVKDDSSIFVAQCDDDNELEELDREDDQLLSTKWLTGCLYADTTGIFAPVQTDKGQKANENILMFLLSAGGALHIYALPDLSKAVYIAEGLCFVPPVLSADYAARRSAARETLAEIIVADLGDDVSKSPYLILRPSNDDLTIYEPYRTTSQTSQSNLSTTLHFLKIHNPHLARNPEVSAEITADEAGDSRNEPMRAISNVSGYSVVFLPGGSPSFVMKSAKSMPKVLSLQGTGVRGMSGFHTAGCDRGFIYADVEGVARVAQLPPASNFAELGVTVRKADIGEDIHAITYHPGMECYAIATSTRTEFELPKDDDHHRDWAKEDITFKPTMEQSYLKLVNPVNWTVVHTIELDPYESVLCMKTLNLEVSEVTNERRQLITVGTAVSKGEDLPTKGRIYVFDVVNVIAESDRPETNKRLKLIAKEEIARGAITAISEIGTQGFMIVAQGQKCMIRGLKEDGTLLPVAFLDLNSYVTSMKELRGTGLCVFGDIIKGVWFAGYTEEPYKMMLFGKSAKSMEIVATELLPDGKELFIIAADSDCNLHIMQYDPEHPKSIQGHLLLHRSTFSLGGHLPTTMTLLPRTKAATILPPSPDAMDIAADATIPEHEILITSSTGSIALLSPLAEAQYRRLSTLASHLTNTLYHPAGLNPRAYRIDRDAPEGTAGSRTVVDGTILMRWMELGSQRRSEVAGRVGIDDEEVRDELVALMGGLGYL